MKNILLYCVFVIFLNSCSHSINKPEPEKKLYIYSINNDCTTIDWYCYSTIGGFTGSKLDFKNKIDSSIETIDSYYLSDIDINKDTLKLQFWSGDTTDLNIHKIPCFKNIQIDTTGEQNKNGVEARIGRILKANIDISKQHNFDSKWTHY